LGVSLECLIPNATYLQQAHTDRVQARTNTIFEAEQFIIDFSNNEDFYSQRAQAALDKFIKYTADDMAIRNVYSADECREMLTSKIQLGCFYQTNNLNGKNCNYSVENARQVAARKNKDVSLDVQSNIGSQPENTASIAQDMYNKMPKATLLVDKLEILKADMPKNTLDILVRSLSVETENLSIKGLEYPHPDPVVQKWCDDNLRPDTIEYLKQQTIIHKLK
jgi:hypothetical protein